MALFGNLKKEGLEQTEDRLGGGFQPLETDLYGGKIAVAYAGESTEGALNVTLVLELEGGKKFSETVYVTNKQKENFFYNKNDSSKKVPLPGFTVIDDLCLVTCDKELSEMETTEKVIKIWDYDAKAELPKSVQVLDDLTGQEISVGIVQQLVNKNVKDASGKYVPGADTKNENYIDKVFHVGTGLTVVEIRNAIKDGKDPTTLPPAFRDAWAERNRGVTRDKRKLKDGAAGTAGKPAAARSNAGPPQAGGAAEPRKSLFAK